MAKLILKDGSPEGKIIWENPKRLGHFGVKLRKQIHEEQLVKRMTVLDINTFGHRLAHARQLRGLTQTELARLCGWETQARISMYETDDREPSHADLIRLARVLGASIVWLLTGDGPVEEDLSSLTQWMQLYDKLSPDQVDAVFQLFDIETQGQGIKPPPPPHDIGDPMTTPKDDLATRADLEQLRSAKYCHARGAHRFSG
jgi:transcriptional regulator with XRE-family HTH domain